MKQIRVIIAIGILSSCLTGCIHPVVTKVNESSERISNLAQTAKSNLEECLITKGQKENKNMSACEDVEANLNEIINTANELPEFVRQHLK